MLRKERIAALSRLGFTDRQAAFLDVVLHHSGVCLPRQYAAFSGIAYGHKINRFFDGLVSRGFGSVCPCLHNRALLYHVHHRPLYSAIGQAHSRLRRPVPAASVMPRLMLVDAIVEARDVTWLASQRDKVEQFTIGFGVAPESLPQRAVRAGGATSSRLFPDALPIGVEAPNRAVFVYPATPSSMVDFRPFLQRHHALLAALPAWSLVLVFAPDETLLRVRWQAVVEREIGPLLGVAEGTGRRVEWRALSHRYGHLSPLVAALAWSQLGVEHGEQRGAQGAKRSQPPWAIALRQTRRTVRKGRRVVSMANNHWPCVL
jgi:hypothetical protein